MIDPRWPANGKVPPAAVGPGPPARPGPGPAGPPSSSEFVVSRPDAKNAPLGYYYPKKIYQLPASHASTSLGGYPPMNGGRSYYYWLMTSFWSRDIPDNRSQFTKVCNLRKTWENSKFKMLLTKKNKTFKMCTTYLPFIGRFWKICKVFRCKLSPSASIKGAAKK